MGFMLAQLQVKYGRVTELSEIMSHIVAVMERQGWTLAGAWQTRIGALNEVWDLWDVGGGAEEIERALTSARSDPEFAAWASRLPEVLESEQVRYLETLPYSP